MLLRGKFLVVEMLFLSLMIGINYMSLYIQFWDLHGNKQGYSPNTDNKCHTKGKSEERQ